MKRKRPRCFYCGKKMRKDHAAKNIWHKAIRVYYCPICNTFHVTERE